MKVAELIKQLEGRRLEFKAKLPAVSDIAKTIVAFANDAGGELLIGIRNESRSCSSTSMPFGTRLALSWD